jgi:hypothetical protein
MQGLRGADNLMTSQNKEDGDGSTIEQKKEVQNVYADLLRGEVTQEVRELRHEMYYAERLSHQYDYGGNGRAVKKNKMFDYNGNVDMSDGYPIQLIQDNREDITLSADFNEFLIQNGKEAIGEVVGRKFTIEIERDFVPTMRLEEFVTKLVVKRISKDRVILDFYTPETPKQFDRRSRIFVNKLGAIYEGDIRTDLIDFKGISFVAYNAYGSDDLREYEYTNIKYELILTYDGNYVLRFTADIVKDGTDMITEFYDESAAEKSQNHEMRKGANFSYEAGVEMIENDKYDAETAEELMKELQQ